MAGRTASGSPSAETRKKYGMKGRGKKGKYPIWDETSCLNTVKLRHNAKGVTAKEALAKASRWANAHNNAA